MTPKEAEAEIKRRTKKLGIELVRVEKDSIVEAKKIARAYANARWSSYKKGTAAFILAQGTPYSKRKPHPPIPVQYIHVISGRFRARFTIKRNGNSNSYRVVTQLLNTSEEWRYLKEGTRYMIRRPLDKEVEKAIHTKRLVTLNRAVLIALYRR